MMSINESAADYIFGLAEESSEDENHLEYKADYHLPAVVAANSIAIVAAVSQLLVIAISRGLESDFSAKTLLMSQAISEISRQLIIAMFSLCGTINGELKEAICLKDRTVVWCKTTYFVTYVLILMPDWMACLVAVDRLISVQSPFWYKEHFTSRAAWGPVVSILGVLIVLGIPRFMGTDLTASGRCSTMKSTYDQVSTFLGLPAVLILFICTFKLVGIMARRRLKARSTTVQSLSQVTVALTWNCFIFCVFALIQYSLLFAAFLFTGTSERKTRILIMSVSNVFGAIGVTLRALIYLTMQRMREALRKALRC